MRYILYLAAVLFSVSALAAEQELPPLPVKRLPTEAEKAMAAYRAQYAAYRKVRDVYERQAAAYWDRIGDKRTARRAKFAAGKTVELNDYVLEQPPVYSGPPAPVPPLAPPRPDKQAKRKPPPVPVPVVADFLRHAKAQFAFVPEKPATEADFKRAYVREALAAGLTKEQIVRIYSFEAGGNGGYDVQAGLESKKPGGKAISTALGYNQLLVANTMGILAHHGQDILAQLQERAEKAPKDRKARLAVKIAKLRRMVKYARSMPYRWATHVKMAGTPKGMALHAVLLDIDIGPLLQTLKLVNSLEHAKLKGLDKPLSAAELEMMNLTGDGNGFDMVTIPKEMRDKIPTSNFFERGGYERNPVASRNNVVSALMAATDRRMDSQLSLDGAKAMAAMADEVARVKAAPAEASAGR
jgi:hypothetical protein